MATFLNECSSMGGFSGGICMASHATRSFSDWSSGHDLHPSMCCTQDRIWVTNAFGHHVTRFPASDPSKAEKFEAGWSGSGLGIDSQGNVWVTNRLGNSIRGALVIADAILTLKTGGNGDEVRTREMAKQTGGYESGSVTMLRPDGSEYPGSPFTGVGLPGPWAATVDGNDNVWVSNFCRSEQSDHGTLWRADGKLSAWLQDRPADLSARWLCGERSADANRSCNRASRRRLGHE
jgi:hypothetical protein